MSDLRSTLTLVCLSGATLAAALYGPALGSPDPAVMLVILFSSLTAAIAGFAFSAICGAILLHLLDDPVRVLQLMTICSLANQALTVWSLRRAVVWSRLGSFVAGGAAGIGPGLWALLHVDHRHVAHGTGAVLLTYAATLLLRRPPKLVVDSRWADAAIGFAGGATGAIAALPSLPVTIWCQVRGLEKDALRATVQPFILAMQLLTLPLLAGTAPGSAIGPADLFCIPAALFGTQIGLGCARGLTNRQFAMAVAGLLVVCGVSFWL